MTRPHATPAPSTPADHRRRRRCTVLVAAALSIALGCGGEPAATASPEVVVAAAADLRPAFEQLASAFARTGGVEVRLVFGSSGQLREQILDGAPFDLFASADLGSVDDIVAAGRAVADTRAEFATGHLALWSSEPSLRPRDVAELASPAYRRIALADPDQAPYGRAARQTLVASGVYERVRTRLVYGENASDALRIAASGNAEVAIVPASLAVASGRPYTAVDGALHDPIRQALVVTSRGSRRAAASFAGFVVGAEGRRVLTRFGYTVTEQGPGPR